MSNVAINDANSQPRKIDTFQRTEGPDTVETQAAAVVNPTSGQAIDFATQATLAAIQTLVASLTGAIGNADTPFAPGGAGQIMLAKRRDSGSTVLASAATFTGTSRDLTVTATATAMANAAAYVKEVRVSAESDQSGTLLVEYSRDNTNWRRAKSAATAAVTGGGQFAEIVLRPSWRYMRVGFTNGATLQTRFTINSMMIAA